MIPIGEIYLVDDEAEILHACRQTFELEGYSIKTFNSAHELLPHIRKDWMGAVITDVKMPGMDGLQLLGEIQKIASGIPVVILTGHGDVPMAIEAIRAGAYDFLEKVAPPEYLLDVARRALETRRLCLENRSLKLRLETDTDIESRILGNSPAVQELRRILVSLAVIDVDVLLIGETGVGKELAANCLHDLGHRCPGSFVPLNCGAISPNLVESELFGHERGAFTNASRRHIGKIECAQGGTLFLDEIESMPLEIQIKLLRTLQERVIERVGGNQMISVDFRVVAASKVDLREAVRRGTFREDLFYRLNVARVPIPPLRNRREDIQLILQYFISILLERFQRPEPKITRETRHRLDNYFWPGNIRELRNVAQQLVLGLDLDLAKPGSGDKSLDQLPFELGFDKLVQQYEKKIITEALALNDGKIEKTAEMLCIPRKRLYLRMQKFGLKR
ncbi:MAG: sigma-54-dependent Fis family transcriptional regulator [Deltaproteobacteria bacterium]|nr:sigma-54-dependent Fis family transcriptional regulator [Deltaproteobacteria bacterium]